MNLVDKIQDNSLMDHYYSAQRVWIWVMFHSKMRLKCKFLFDFVVEFFQFSKCKENLQELWFMIEGEIVALFFRFVCVKSISSIYYSKARSLIFFITIF